MKVLDLSQGRDRWPTLAGEAGAHHGDYRILTTWAPIPDELVEGYCRLNTAFLGEAPAGEAALELERWDTKRVRDREERVARAGRRDVHTFALDASGEVVALTELFINETVPHRSFQSGTLVMPDHRGHRLGLAIKLANLRELVERYPQVEWIVTGNASINAAMNVINDLLGVLVVERRLEMRKGSDPADAGPAGHAQPMGVPKRTCRRAPASAGWGAGACPPAPRWRPRRPPRCSRASTRGARLERVSRVLSHTVPCVQDRDAVGGVGAGLGLAETLLKVGDPALGTFPQREVDLDPPVVEEALNELRAAGGAVRRSVGGSSPQPSPGRPRRRRGFRAAACTGSRPSPTTAPSQQAKGARRRGAAHDPGRGRGDRCGGWL